MLPSESATVPSSAVSSCQPSPPSALAELGQLVGGDARAEHLAAVEADVDLLGLSLLGMLLSVIAGGLDDLGQHAAGRAGCRNATREPRMPVRGCSSISRIPAFGARPSVASMSSTW